MAASHLIAVPSSNPSTNVSELGVRAESAGQRIRVLQQEARALAREEIDLLAGDLSVLAGRAGEVAGSGDAYPTGIRELATRIEEDIARHVTVLRGLMDRAAHA